MSNFFIYTGYGILLIGCLIAMIGGIKAWLIQQKSQDKMLVKRCMNKIVWPSFIIMGVGLVLAGIGIAIGLS